MFNPIRSVDLKTAFRFGDKHKGHSAQFRSTIQKRWKYWTKGLKDLDVPFNDKT
jgi:hypothetical protein